MNGQWQGTKQDRSGTLRQQLEGWASYMSEMEYPERDDFRVMFLDGARKILHDFEVDLVDGVVLHASNGGQYRCTAYCTWLGLDVSQVSLGWSRVPSGYVYDVTLMAA